MDRSFEILMRNTVVMSWPLHFYIEETEMLVLCLVYDDGVWERKDRRGKRFKGF